MGMVMLKGMFGHTAESSIAAFDCKRPAYKVSDIVSVSSSNGKLVGLYCASV